MMSTLSQNERDEAFCEAVTQRHDLKAKYLMEQGVNLGSGAGRAGMTLAFWHGAELTQLLLEAPCDVNAPDHRGDTLLHDVAGRPGTYEHKSAITRLLLQKGGDFTRCNHAGFTPLTLAARWGLLEACRTFIEQGADINAFDGNGVTALMQGVQDCKNTVVKFFLTHGASPWLWDIKNDKALVHLALDSGSGSSDTQETLKLLIEHGVDMWVEGYAKPNAFGGVLACTGLIDYADDSGHRPFLEAQAKLALTNLLESFTARTGASHAFLTPDGKPTQDAWRMIAFGYLPKMLEYDRWKDAPQEALKLWNAVGPYYRQKHQDIDLTFAKANIPAQAEGWENRIQDKPPSLGNAPRR